ncbi:MAG: PD40 domain-containing protein [Acidobacteria bacterium]|nr:PD40 domain-containing protein [Acidobacteriota bacterium]MBI4475886.1 PD40 domain-containing protein [Acidobacteriota bacterium]
MIDLPLTGTDPLARGAVEFSREEFDTFNGRFSPDGRLMAYSSNESNNRADQPRRPTIRVHGSRGARALKKRR